MNTTENGKTRHTLRLKPSFTTRKATQLHPIKRKTAKAPSGEYIPMVLQPPPEAESVQQYAVPLAVYGRRASSSDDSAREMRQICSRLDEYTKDLEDLYGKKNGEVAEESSQMRRQFYSFLSSCDSAARELDATINIEHKILESLYEGYQKEVQLLEQLGNEDITAESDISASHDKVTALISRLMKTFQRLEGIKNSYQNLQQEHLLTSSLIKTEKKSSGVEIQGSALQSGSDDRSETADHVVRALQELMTDSDIRSKEVLERIIHDVAQQATELQKLGKDNKETENKYIQVKADYQALLQKKRMIEVELKELLAWKTSQRSSPMLSPSPEEGLEKDIEPVPSTPPASAITQESEGEIIFSCGSQEDEEVEKVIEVSESQDKTELQEGPTPPADSSVSILYEKAKILEEKDTDLSEVPYTLDLDKGDIYMYTSAEPSDPEFAENEENKQPDGKTVLSSLNLQEVTEEEDYKVKMKKQKQLKSVKKRGRRPGTVSSTVKEGSQGGRESSKRTFVQGGKRGDESVTEIKDHQDPEMLTRVSNQLKTAPKPSKIPSSQRKVKAKRNKEDALVTSKASVESDRAQLPAPYEQQEILGGPRPAGQQRGRKQSLSSKPRRLSLSKEGKDIRIIKEEKDKHIHKDLIGKREIMKGIPEYQPEKQMATEEVHTDSLVKPSVDGNREHFTGHSLYKALGPDQDFLGYDRSTEESAGITPYSGAMSSTANEQDQEDMLPNNAFRDTFPLNTSAFAQSDPISTSDSAEEGLGTQDSQVMDLCEMEKAEKNVSPNYDDTKKKILHTMSKINQTVPSGTIDKTLRTRRKMEFPDLKPQRAKWQLYSEKDSHHAQREDPRKPQLSTVADTTYPPSHHNSQTPDLDDIDDTHSRFLSSEKSHLHLDVLPHGHQLPPLEHKRQQVGQAAPMPIRKSHWKLDIADLVNWMTTNYPILGQRAGPKTKKFHPPMIPSQQHQVRKVEADEFPLSEKTFPQRELNIQGCHMSFTHSLPTEDSSRIPSPAQTAERRVQLLNGNRIIPMEYSTLPTMTVKGSGRVKDLYKDNSTSGQGSPNLQINI
ncbi:coiled-coil domain-containing protein 7 isoform X2 [Dendropsophus ebraccatus]|uniref:coiled-coil domain-containing protein 7 isoform X2 n=1 Tax=Dendropsophus ebraccatus TaxID=150705 RepID=UPI003831A787